MSIAERIPVVVAEPKSPFASAVVVVMVSPEENVLYPSVALFASAVVVVMVSPEENVLYPSVALLASICERYSSEIVVAPT